MDAALDQLMREEFRSIGDVPSHWVFPLASHAPLVVHALDPSHVAKGACVRAQDDDDKIGKMRLEGRIHKGSNVLGKEVIKIGPHYYAVTPAELNLIRDSRVSVLAVEQHLKALGDGNKMKSGRLPLWHEMNRTVASDDILAELCPDAQLVASFDTRGRVVIARRDQAEEARAELSKYRGQNKIVLAVPDGGLSQDKPTCALSLFVSAAKPGMKYALRSAV
jgi:hypothetical protein